MNNTSIKDWLSLISSDNNIPPDTLDIGMIELMHPDCGENIVFMKIPPNKIPFYYPCKISELRKYLPGVAEFLMQDGYVTVNAFCKTRWRTVKDNGVCQKKATWRTLDMVRTLYTCFCDIDYYKLDPNLTFEEAVVKIFDAVAQGLIPEPSIIARSGRGVYVFWLLDPPVILKPPAKKDPQLATYNFVQRHINEILSPIGADPVATFEEKSCFGYFIRISYNLLILSYV